MKSQLTYDQIIEILTWQLPNFRDVIKNYILKFKENEIIIDLVNTRHSGLNQQNKKLTIFTPAPIKNRINIMWDILHEYGHLLDGEPDYNMMKKQDPDYMLKRENTAWDFALVEFSKWEVLKPFTLAMQDYKASCLKHYSQ